MLRALLTQRIKEKALDLGFDRVGIAPVEDVPDEKLLTWLKRDYHGEMQYMARGVDKRLDPSLILEGARTVLSVALNYYHSYTLPYHDPASGVVSRYASGDDYHEVLGHKLKALMQAIEELCPGAAGRIYVDTGPVMDKHWAARSGIGWIGKNANLIAGKKLGSWFFIGEILLNRELDPDAPGRDHCGSCRRCLDECPTEAIVEPYVRGQPPLHLLPDDRSETRHSRGAASRQRESDLWLRYLPGCVPLESPSSRVPRAFLCPPGKRSGAPF